MKICSFSTIFGVLAAAYLAHTIYVLYGLWYPEACDEVQRKQYCVKSAIHEKPDKQWSVKVFISPSKSATFKQTLLWTVKDIEFGAKTSRTLNVTLPSEVKNNGSLFLFVYVYPSHKFSRKTSVSAVTTITDYAVPVSYIQLLANSTVNSKKTALPETHWKPKITFHVLNDPFVFDYKQIPPEIYPFFKMDSERLYLPMLYIDELSFVSSDLQPIDASASEMKLTIHYEPISLGKLRFWETMSHSMEAMKALGFTNKDIDDMKGIFTGTNLFFLIMTFTVSIFHVLFDFLAFKNEISYWKKRETMAGLSVHTVVYRCVSTIIIFLYLLDQQTSLLVLVPAGVGSVIELWKVKKALKVKISFASWLPKVRVGSTTEVEKDTETFDHQAITYLSYVLYPLCLGAAVYSLVYVPHKSWHSWVIQSLVNAVYAFGFLFMLPQLFINYKLKSVAHLPWRAFMYKAFNTFIDDVFAFIVRMPTSHRLACFRDDIVFFCYLYQLWLYPVDKSRPNEFGLTYDDGGEKRDAAVEQSETKKEQ